MTELSDKKIHAGWEQTFSTNNPFCPCDLKSFTKAVRWAERALATPAPAHPDPLHVANERGEGEPVAWRFRNKGTYIWSYSPDDPQKPSFVCPQGWGKNWVEVEPLYSCPMRSVEVPDELYGVSNDEINWPLVCALIEAHMTASRYHSPGTSNWGAWLYKSIVKAAREAAPKEKK